jgi:phosphomannomutase
VSEHDALQRRVATWIADDPDAASRAELQRLLAAGDFTALQERFAAPLEFGTAGLRGELGAGPARMNRAVVARAAAGVCAHLIAHVPDAQRRGLCIGYDGRHQSKPFAEETAAIAAAAGFCVRVFEAPGPTPLLAYAVLAHGAAGGVMVTASHNPACDNGYKVYWHDGAQIIAPHDEQIAAAMQALPSVLAVPRMSAEERRARGLEQPLDAAFERRYLSAVAELTGSPCAHMDALCVAYTALHGVGEKLARAALTQAGVRQLHSVDEQATPDPDFPTVAFPNPEEKGAMDRVLALAERVRADLVLANDPDADRLAVAARDRLGKLRAFTGNEVGVLLADHVLEQSRGPGKLLVLTSIVSTPMIAAVAAAHDAHWEPVLTGFKWIGNRAMQLDRERGLRFVFGFEEALGYTAGTLVRDKDGISSAVLAARLAAQLKAKGRTLHDQLELLFRRHGLYLSTQVSIRLEGSSGAQRREALMQQVRAAPPSALAGMRVNAALDLKTGSVSGSPSASFKLPASDALLWELEGGHRVCVRPSGTEPKIKVYFDVREPVRPEEAIEAAQARARATAEALAQDMRARLA